MYRFTAKFGPVEPEPGGSDEGPDTKEGPATATANLQAGIPEQKSKAHSHCCKSPPSCPLLPGGKNERRLHITVNLTGLSEG